MAMFAARLGSALVVAGGVAANAAMRAALARLRQRHAASAWSAPPLRLCTDNAVMVAWAAIERLRLGWTDRLDFAPRPRWPLEAAGMLPADELPPRLPCRQFRGLHEARAAGAGCCARCSASRRRSSCWTRMPAPGPTTSQAERPQRTGEWRAGHRPPAGRPAGGAARLRGAGRAAWPVSRLAGAAPRAAAAGRPAWPAASCIPRTHAALRRRFAGDRQAQRASARRLGGAGRAAAAGGAARRWC